MGIPIRKYQAESNDGAPLLRIRAELPTSNDIDPRVLLFPTFAIPLQGDDVWRVLIQGRISQPAPASFSQRLMLRGLLSALELSSDYANDAVFKSRVEGFLASPLGGERIQIELAGQHYVLQTKSKRSGLFNCKLDIPASLLAQYRTSGEQEDAPFKKPINASPPEVFSDGSVPVFLAKRRGVSVVTDIDDTIKLTEVTSRRRMLKRTFIEPFEAIQGMAEAYHSWEKQGALFHYVSSSPWQIYRPIEQFMQEHDFPAGSMHLKWFRLRDEIFKGWRLLRRKSKGGVIKNLIKRMPDRTFVLVGDSGERDPEIYAKLASKFPNQIVRICIRQIDANPLNVERLDHIYKTHGFVVPFQVFSHPQQLGDLLPHDGTT